MCIKIIYEYLNFLTSHRHLYLWSDYRTKSILKSTIDSNVIILFQCSTVICFDIKYITEFNIEKSFVSSFKINR